MTDVAELWAFLQPHAVPFGLVLARVVGVAWPLTSWGAAGLGFRTRLMMAAVVAGLLAPAVGPLVEAGVPDGAGVGGLAGAGLGELASGLALGLAACLVAGAACQGGELIGLAAGLTPQIDPGPPSGPVAAGGGPDEPLTPAGALYGAVALATFLAMDGPLLLVVGLAESYQVMPAAGLLVWPGLPADAGLGLAEAIGRALTVAVRLATPIVLPIVLAQAVLLVMTRVGPVAPWASLSWPLRLGLAVVLIGVGMGWAVDVFGRAWLEILPGGGP
jgi:flagellar biosynthesis protein FliR